MQQFSERGISLIGQQGGIDVYRWIVLAHVLSALAFMAAHGGSIAVSFKLKASKSADDVRHLLGLSAYTVNAMYVTFAAVALTGLVAGVWLSWWRTGWFWVSVVVLIGIAYAMVPLAMQPFHRLRFAIGEPYMGDPPAENRRKQPGTGQLDQAAMEQALAELRPRLLALIAFGGVAVLVWLMSFKPF